MGMHVWFVHMFSKTWVQTVYQCTCKMVMHNFFVHVFLKNEWKRVSQCACKMGMHVLCVHMFSKTWAETCFFCTFLLFLWSAMNLLFFCFVYNSSFENSQHSITKWYWCKFAWHKKWESFSINLFSWIIQAPWVMNLFSQINQVICKRRAHIRANSLFLWTQFWKKDVSSGAWPWGPRHPVEFTWK